ncbi:MAG: alpha/beta hydrolase [Actinobacteria bacterium]|nr:alpha/beta hydrolase [Actinomycetota bacterium]
MQHRLIEVRERAARPSAARRATIVLGSAAVCLGAVLAFAGGDDLAGSGPDITVPVTTTVPATTTTVPATTTVAPSTTLPAPTDLVAASARVHDVPRLVLADLPASEQLVRISNIAYGPLPEQQLDMWRSSGPRLHPGAIVYVHGGAWNGGDKDIVATPFATLLEHLITEEGWTVFSINYRVGAAFPDALLDVNRAVRWVKAHSYEYGIDPEQVVAYGHSAGGHLAAMLGTTWNDPTLQPADLPAPLANVSPRPVGVVSLSAPLDPKAWGDSNPNPADQFSGGGAVATFAGCVGEWYTSCTPEQLAAVDVSTYADPADPPVYVAHGDLDGVVHPFEQQGALLRMQAAHEVVWYDFATVGAEADRNHVMDAVVNVAALRAFLDAVT